MKNTFFFNFKSNFKKKIGIKKYVFLKNIFHLTINIIFNTIYFLPAIIFRLLNYRFPTFQTSRIGHILDESETFIKEKKLGLINFKSIMLAPKNQIANRFALNLFKEHHLIIYNYILCKFLNRLRFHPLTQYDVRKYVVSIDKASYFHKINNTWKNRPSILSKSQISNSENFEKLFQLGIPKNSWFVCVHARDIGYSPHDDVEHNFRNSLIEDYYESMDYINLKGG